MKRVIAALLQAADWHVLAGATAGTGLEARNHPSTDTLLATCDTSAVSLVALDTTDAGGRSRAPIIELIRRRQPSLPILVFCSASAAGSAGVVDAVRAGASGLVFRGADDSGIVIRQAIRGTMQRSITGRIYERVSPAVPSSLQPFLQYAISRASDDPTVEEAAKTLRVDRKTLLNRLSGAGLVKPGEFLNWVRLSIAVGLLEDASYTIDRAALEAGFASQSAFRNMLGRYTRGSCAQYRAPGSFDRILALFVDRLRGRGGVRDITPPADASPSPNVLGSGDVRARA